MKKTLIAMCAAIAAVSMTAQTELNTENLEKEIKATTTASLNEKVWGLVCPRSSAIIEEIKDLSAEKHRGLTILPIRARFENGALVFRLRDNAAVVGVGNCENKLPPNQRSNFGQRFDVEIEVEQSTPEKTVWTLIPWANGERTKLSSAIKARTDYARSRKLDVEKQLRHWVYRFCRREVTGVGRHVIRIEDTGGFYRRFQNTSPFPFDGFELEIKGSKDAEIKINSVRISKKTRSGGFRKEFTLPAGKVWHAVASVNRKTLLHVNSKEVPNSSLLNARPHPHAYQGQQLQEVNLKPFLKSGKNVIAVYPAFSTDANAFMQASVVMESGEIIDLNTDPTWRYVSKRVKGWDELGYTGKTEKITKTMPFSASYLPKELTAIKYGYRIYMRYTHCIPAYGGRILLKSPDDNQLYFSADKPFKILADCPSGLAARKPSIEWLLCRYQKDGKLEKVLSGKTDKFIKKDDSIVFELDGGDKKLPMGVYVIKTVMHAADGKVIENRTPEPLIVTGRIPMKETVGETFEDGLDLQEEAVIDFTNPDDPQFPWMEIDGKEMCKKPLIVNRNGLKYRETRLVHSDFNTQALITYNYKFKHPGDFYLMKLEYPDDRPRFFGVNLCSEHDGPDDHSKAGPSVWTGIWHLNTGKMKELTWLFRPDPGYTSINLINMLSGSTAAASKLRIYRVKGHLPELKTDGNARYFGFLTETTRTSGGFGKTFRSSDDPCGARKKVLELGHNWKDNVWKTCPLKVRLETFTEWLDTCNHYTEYLRWAGQNIIFLAFYQYDGSASDAEPSTITGDCRIAIDIASIAARVFRDNGIDFFSGIYYIGDPVLQAKYENNTDSAESPFVINCEGKSCRKYEGGYNFNHPEVQRSMLRVAEEAVHKFKNLPNFRGVNFGTSFKSPMELPNYFTGDDRHLPVDPLRYDYSDVTIRCFEKDTGIKVPADRSPNRFKIRYKLLTSDAMREKWVEWRAQNMLDFFIEIRDRLRKIKPDIKVATGMITSGFFFDYAVASGKSDTESMRDFGWDYSKFHRQEGIYTVPWLQGTGRYGFTNKYTTRNDRYEKYLKRLRSNTSPAHLKIGDGDTERMAMIDYCWLELERSAQKLLPRRPHWQVPFQYTMEGAAQGTAALRPFLQAMAAIDPDTLLYGFTDANMIIGNEQPLREFAQFLRSLPKVKFKPFKGENSELIMRTLRKDDKLLFYALNPAPWPVKATINVENADEVKNLITGKTTAIPVQVIIPAYHGISFEAGGKAIVSNWKTQGIGAMFAKYQEHMRKKIQITENWLNDRKINSVLLPDQKKTMSDILRCMKQAQKDQRYAEIWQLLNSWDFIWCSYFLEQQNKAVALITETDPAPVDLKKKMIKAAKTNTPPVIDGKLDDEIWKQTKPQTGFIDKDGKPSLIGTTVRTTWDDKKLYLAFRCRDNFPGQLKKDAEGEKEVMKDDCIVFLLQPNMKNNRHFQMAFTAAGIKFDQKDYDYAFAPDWKVAVKINPNGWTAEVAFPFKALETTPTTDAKWGANFCRIFRKNLLPWSTWSYMPKDWHNPDNYGTIEFK